MFGVACRRRVDVVSSREWPKDMGSWKINVSIEPDTKILVSKNGEEG